VHTQPQPGEATTAPEACPFCKSRDIATTSKAVDASTYWRCTKCGQIWNAFRLQQHGRHLRSNRFG
jgi:transposase-like protein